MLTAHFQATMSLNYYFYC